MMELEFVCANPNYPNFTELLEIHEHAFDYFSHLKEECLPYRQLFSDGTYSFAIIMLNDNEYLKNRAIDHCNAIGLPLDQTNEITEDFTNRVKNHTLDYII